MQRDILICCGFAKTYSNTSSRRRLGQLFPLYGCLTLLILVFWPIYLRGFRTPINTFLFRTRLPGMLFRAHHIASKLLLLSVATAMVNLIPHPLAWQVGQVGIWLFFGASSVFVPCLVIGLFFETRCPFCNCRGPWVMNGNSLGHHCPDCGLTESSLFSIGLRRSNDTDS